MKKIILMPVLCLCVASNSLIAQAQTTNDGAWLTKSEDTATGKRFTATLKASSAQTATGDPIRLMIACNSGKSELAIQWGGYMHRGSKISTQLRIDSYKVFTSDWRVYNDTQVAYAENPEDILNKLVNSNEVIIRTTYFKGGIATAYFNTAGIDQALTSIRKACHW